MCHIACDICNQSLMGYFESENFDEHICKTEDIQKYIKSLKEQQIKAESKLDKIQNEGFLLLKNICLRKDENNEINLKEEDFKALFNTLKLHTVSASNYPDFDSQWLHMHALLIHSFEIFENNRKYYKDKNIIFFLERLLKVCQDAAKVFGYKEEWKTVEELIKEIKES